MARAKLSPALEILIKSAGRLAEGAEAEAVVMLAERPYDFVAIRKMLRRKRMVVASDKPDVQQAVTEDEIDLVPLLHEPQTRQTQMSQALVEAVADDLLKAGDKVVAMYGMYERDIDTLTVIELGEQLSKLTSRELRRLESQVPLETLRQVVDMAVEIGRDGREGKPVGTLFVVGSHRKVLPLSNEGVHDPFRGYGQDERKIRNPRVRESIKELAQLDGAFIISADGIVQSAGRMLSVPSVTLTLSKGLGARHWAAAAISKSTGALAIAVSESTGTVRIFQDGIVVLRIEPMDRGMVWHDVETAEPPTET